MRWLRLLVIGAVAACALPACAGVSFAQVPAPVYMYAELTDETNQPVFGAATVVYNESGEEIASSATDPDGRTPLLMNRGRHRFIVRILKAGYLTYEGVFETTGEYRNAEIKIKLISDPKSKTGASRRASPSLKPAPKPSGLSPPTTSRRVRAAVGRAPPYTFLQGHPT